jgi:hypothetical protein
MAISRCSSCQQTGFEAIEKVPARSNYKLIGSCLKSVHMVQCQDDFSHYRLVG